MSAGDGAKVVGARAGDGAALGDRTLFNLLAWGKRNCRHRYFVAYACLNRSHLSATLPALVSTVGATARKGDTLSPCALVKAACTP
ncbi:MAG: hypothetical protein IT518_09805 [Burkholderiales bacterium]|nr:hypothetical protein [Burkholderiales bacterium]